MRVFSVNIGFFGACAKTKILYIKLSKIVECNQKKDMFY